MAGVDISALDCQFEVFKSTKREPNTASLTVFNMAQTTLGRINDTDQGLIRISAGYVGGLSSLLFVGEARGPVTEIQDVDRSITFEGRDGGRNYAISRMAQSYPPGTRAFDVLQDCVEAMRVGRGNLSEFQDFALSHGGADFPDGFTAHGQTHRIVNQICRGAGLRWSIQNNAFQLLRRRQALQTTAVRLSPETGLKDTPVKGKRGRVQAISAIIPGLDPGRRLILESRTVSGTYIIKAVTYSGDTRGDNWDATIDLVPVE